MQSNSFKDVCDSLVYAFAVGALTILTVLALACFCSAADISIGDKIGVTGNIKTNGCIEWADDSIQCNASAVDLSGINNYLDILNQTDGIQFEQLALRQVTAEKGQPNGYASLDSSGLVPLDQLPVTNYHYNEARLYTTDPEPQWQTQGNVWTSFVPAFTLSIDKLRQNSLLRLTYTDSIGIYSTSWCNVGIFLNDNLIPECTGSWFGIYGTTTYNQQTFSCVVPAPQGQYTITARHRSDACIYGIYGFDEYGLNRRLMGEEL